MLTDDKNHRRNYIFDDRSHLASQGTNDRPVGGGVHGRMPKNAAAEQLHNIRTQSEAGALTAAVKNVDIKSVAALLHSRVDPNRYGYESEFAPLHIAAASESPFAVGIVDQLLRFGANPNFPARNSIALTPVHIACLAGNHNILQLLLERGGDQHQLDRTGRPPIYYAYRRRHKRCIEKLLAYDGVADATPATPQKREKRGISLPVAQKHRSYTGGTLRRQNSLTSTLSSPVSDYQSCVPDDDDDDDYENAYDMGNRISPVKTTLPKSTDAAFSNRRASDSQLQRQVVDNDPWGDAAKESKYLVVHQKPPANNDDDVWGDNNSTRPTVKTSSPQKSTKTAASNVTGYDDGWGDNNNSNPTVKNSSPQKSKTAAPIVTGNDDGWGDSPKKSSTKPITHHQPAADLDAEGWGDDPKPTVKTTSPQKQLQVASKASQQQHQAADDGWGDDADDVPAVVESKTAGLFHAERYRVVPSAPMPESDGTQQQVPADSRKHHSHRQHRRQHVGFRETRRGEYPLYDDQQFLDLCERVDHALRVRKRYKEQKRAEKAAALPAPAVAVPDSAIETDDDDENYVPEKQTTAHHCPRFERHHHRHSSSRHRHRHEDDDEAYDSHRRHHQRSRSAGNNTVTSASSTTGRSRYTAPPVPASVPHHRHRDYKLKHSKSTEQFRPLTPMTDDNDENYLNENKLNEIKNQRDAAAMYAFLACKNDKQLRQLLIFNKVAPNPIITTSTRFFYVRKLVRFFTTTATASAPAAAVAPAPPSRYSTPPKKPSSRQQNYARSTASNPAMLHYAEIRPNPMPPSPPQEANKKISPIIIYPPVRDNSSKTTVATDYSSRKHKNDDVLTLCHEMKKVLLQRISPTEQQQLVDELSECGQVNIGSTANKLQRDGNFSKKPTKGFFVYLLLDPRVLARHLRSKVADVLTDDQKQFAAFLRAIFYVGKGKRSRPMAHLVEARRRMRSRSPYNSNNNNAEDFESNKTQRICDIWRSDYGVVQVQCFHNCTAADAHNREAVIIDALMQSSTNGDRQLTNAQRGSCYGAVKHSWSDDKKRLAGAALLYKAYQIFCIQGESQLYASEIEF